MTQFAFFFQVSLQPSALQVFEVDTHVALKITRLHRRSHAGMRKKDVLYYPIVSKSTAFLETFRSALLPLTYAKTFFLCRSNRTNSNCFTGFV